MPLIGPLPSVTATKLSYIFKGLKRASKVNSQKKLLFYEEFLLGSLKAIVFAVKTKRETKHETNPKLIIQKAEIHNFLFLNFSGKLIAD